MNDTPCRSCGTKLVWAATSTGKRAPFDAEPTLTGNTVLVHRTVGEAPIARTATKEEQATRDDERLQLAQRVLFLSHFSTCPDAAKYRKRKAAGAAG